MTLYETIFTRRQVRNFLNAPVPKDCLDHILACATEAEQLTGQHADFKLLPAAEVSANQGASHYSGCPFSSILTELTAVETGFPEWKNNHP